MPAKYLKKQTLFFLLWLLYACIHKECYAHVHIQLEPLDTINFRIMCRFDLDTYDGIYAQSLIIKIDDPEITISKMNSSTEPVSQYISACKENKMVFSGSCIFTGTLHAPSLKCIKQAYIYITYQLLSEKYGKTVALALDKALPAPDAAPALQTHIDTQFMETCAIEEDTTLNHLTNNIVSIREQLAHQKTSPYYPNLLIFFTIICILIGLFFIYKATYTKRLMFRTLIVSMGMAILACSIVLATKTYQALYEKHTYHTKTQFLR